MFKVQFWFETRREKSQGLVPTAIPLQQGTDHILGQLRLDWVVNTVGLVPRTNFGDLSPRMFPGVLTLIVMSTAKE